jgi:hypothetical protein
MFLHISIEDEISPVAFSIVAGISTSHPIVARYAKEYSGKPYIETIKASPINPPPGIPDITIPLIIEIIIHKIIDVGFKKSIPNTVNKNTIFKTALIQEPSICIVLPKGRDISVTSLLSFILFATIILVGSVASEDCVDIEQINEGIISLKNILTPSILL